MEKVLLGHLQQQTLNVSTTEAEDPELAKAKETLRQIQADKAEARRLRAEDLLSLAEFAREIKRLEAKEELTRERVSALSTTPVRASSTAMRIVRDWGNYTVDMKRQEIERSIEAVVIKPAGKGGSQRGIFRPELIEIVWKC
ncbi:hypothetical protein C4B68_25405 [Streptomyces dengpaensis]|uniref:Uncharacterized protein n=1 Tax=Streptomyces dengpaensis TaxID=2049881 RepID=A0ABM6SV56_9ACTN|nr:hypothetical protein C4B68_25405 [Streptomyces dengpaensis]PIB11390.1 hypothetical protein B1C81_06220 [Streptomyces sp. HG99]